MPAHKKVTREMQKNIVILFKSLIPVKLIGQLYHLDTNTILNHIPEEYKKEATDFNESGNKNKLHLLKILAWLLADEVGCSLSMDTPAIADMKPLLFAHLHLIEWERFISGIITYKNIAERNTFSDEVTEGFRKLINDLYPLPKVCLSAKKFIEDMLIKMHNEEIPFPADAEIGSPKKALTAYVEKMFVAKINESRHFDGRFVSFLTQMMRNKSTREGECVCAYYGIYEETPGDIADKYDLTTERFRMIKEKGVQGLINALALPENNFINKNISDYIEIKNLLIETENSFKAREEEYEPIKNSLFDALKKLADYIKYGTSKLKSSEIQEVMDIIEQRFPDTNLQILAQLDDLKLLSTLQTPLDCLELSVRAYNCLKSAKINTLVDLVTYTSDELIKFRNFGQRSISELEQMLHERGLHFGMTFRAT